MIARGPSARDALTAAVPAPRLGGVFFWVGPTGGDGLAQRTGRGAWPGPQGSSCQSDLPAGGWAGAGIG